MKKPSVKDMKKFVEVFNNLSKFEAEYRMKGVGVFENSDFPMPGVKVVMAWLSEKIKREDKDRVDILKEKYEDILDDLRVKISTARNDNDFITSDTLQEEFLLYAGFLKDLEKLGTVGDTVS